KTKLFQIKLATRIALIALVTAVPLLGVTLFFIFTTASKDIRFGQWELYGNEYQRPLETLLQWLPQHQSLVTRARAGDGSVGSALLALPEMQERLATVTAFGLELLQHPSVTPKEHTQLSVHASLLKDVDLDRITADAQTALNEDANFYDVSESLQRNLPPALK